jgi:hypothetical protein
MSLVAFRRSVDALASRVVEAEAEMAGEPHGLGVTKPEAGQPHTFRRL